MFSENPDRGRNARLLPDLSKVLMTGVFDRLRFLAPVFLAAAASLQAAPVITEFMAQNGSTLADEDGDFSDWIEIHNPTAAPVDLGGWHLTDRRNDPTMWEFPSVTMAPGEYLVVFASNKNRRVPGQTLHTNFALSVNGEYLGLIAPDGTTIATEFAPSFPPQLTDVSYGFSVPGEWVRLIGKSDSVRVHVPTEASGPALGTDWRERIFDDSSWIDGTMAVGFKNGANDPVGMRDIFETDVQAQMYNLPNRQSVYLRVPFEIDNPADVLGLELRTQYDDGYAAFLNGSVAPVDEVNAPSSLQWNSQATAIIGDGGGLPLRTADLTNQLDLLVSGTNVLAIHGLNANQGSSDLLIAPQLWALIPSASEPAHEGYFFTPTPGAPNPGNESVMLVETVSFSEPPRTFPATISLAVSLSGAGPGQVIRYTTNGSVPTASSELYTATLDLTATTMLRARVFDSNGIGGRTESARYLRLHPNVANRQSNLPMVVLDARGQDLHDVNRRDGYFLLFDQDENGVSDLSRLPDVATRQGIRLRGSSSQGQPKRPYSVEFWDDFDQDRRIEVLGMTAEEDWIFYAPYNFDRAYMRNSVAYELSRRIGRWAPNTRFVEVFYNGNGGMLDQNDYVGVYAIVEQVKMNTRRLGHRLVEPTDVPPPGPINPLATGNWTGGYLFKIDRTDPDEYDWRTSRNIPSEDRLTLSRPKLPNLDGGPYFSNAAAQNGSRQVAYLRSYIQAFEDALFSDRNTSFITRNHLDYIDRDSWVDHLIINVLTKNVDALRLSAFFHKPENEKLFAGPVWDFDRSMGSYDGRDASATGWDGSGGTQYFHRDWWGWLCQDPDFAQAFYDRWAVLRSGPLSHAGLADIVQPMGDEIHNSANGLGSAAVRDAARWSQNTPRSGGYPAEVQHLLNWMQTRAVWMDRRMMFNPGSLLPEPPQINISGNTATITGSGSGQLYFTLDGSDPRLIGGEIGGQQYTGAITLDGPLVITARRRFGGQWSTPVTEIFNMAPPAPVFLRNDTADWTVNSHWDTNPAPYPNGAGAAALINPPLGGDRNVDLPSPVTVGRIAFPQNVSANRNRLRGQLPGNSLTFDNGESPARLEVGGTGTGFVEFEIVGGTILQSTLELDVSNITGDPEHGALRLRQGWSGPGGLTKTGPGVASFTGEDKLYSGPTLIGEGVLRVTGPSTMTNSSSVTVLDGGQLRLVSGSSPGVPRVHTFGGDLFLSGAGRGGEIPEASGLGRLGALRYDPGNQDNHAIVTNHVEITTDASIHVDGSRNRLDLTGSLGGTGSLTKSGGGTLGIFGDQQTHTSPVSLANGQLLLRGSLGSSISLGETSILNAAGQAGPLSGTGTLFLPGTALSTPQVAGLHHAMVFTRTGPPDLLDPANAGNALLVTGDPGIPSGIDLYLDLPSGVNSSTIVQGGYLRPAGASWDDLFDHPATRVFVRDPAGSHEFDNRTWTLNTGALLASVPVTLPTPGESLHGRILEIRFDGALLSYQAWREDFFDPGDVGNDTISGPEATPFADGIPNLLRFALGIDGGNGSGSLPVLTHEAGNAIFSFRYDPRLRGLRWIVEATEDLTDWSEAEALFDSNEHLDLPDPEGRLAIGEEMDAPKRFYRLRVATVP